MHRGSSEYTGHSGRGGKENKFQITQGDQIVHPILIYADLVATGDSRNLETARMIYDK
jgi:hypothetical protein